MRHWPKRKLTKTDGEYILWHVLEHLGTRSDAANTVRSLLDDFTERITDHQIIAASTPATQEETVIRMLQFAIAHKHVRTCEQLREVSDMALGIAKIDGLDRPTPASYGEALQYETIQGLLNCGSFNEYADVRKRAIRVLDAVSGNPDTDGI